MEYYSLIIAGSRGWNDYLLLEQRTREFTKRYVKPTGKELQIISGTANGADKLGEQLADHYKLPLIQMPADWDKHGRSAGYKRNEQMAAIASGCIVFWDGQSRGSFHMMNIAFGSNLDLWIITPDGKIHESPGELANYFTTT